MKFTYYGMILGEKQNKNDIFTIIWFLLVVAHISKHVYQNMYIKNMHRQTYVCILQPETLFHTHFCGCTHRCTCTKCEKRVHRLFPMSSAGTSRQSAFLQKALIRLLSQVAAQQQIAYSRLLVLICR